MAFTASDVKKLREMTGVGMMDCKKALVETNGDIDAAIAFLREKGLAAAAKKSGRIAAEGIVFADVNADGVGVIVEVNSETDFVAKNTDFQKFVEDVAGVVTNNDPDDLDSLLEMNYPGTDLTVAEVQQDKILVIGEKIGIRRFERIAEGYNVTYVHMGGNIGVLVNMDVSDNISDSETVKELGKDVAMQIAAMRPRYLNADEVDEETIEEEKRILMAQTLQEGKPEAIAEKIVAGRIKKFYEEYCLLNQAFVKESKQTVGEHIESVAKELGGTISVVRFVRYEKGEGIEKRSDNLADEVAKMVGK
ncbi:MAG: elongation factor Ts [Clostridiales bacterium]|jgi:elongation factor Ts|nr:elongation factor Ts [Clostridiales bacterium]